MISKIFTALSAVTSHPVNAGRSKLSTAVAYAASQLSAKFLAADVCVEFPNSTHLLISPQMKGAAHFINPGLCEFDEMCFVAHSLKETDLFVDVGANVGAYTVLASGVAKCRTIAFEPVPFAFRFLTGNIRLNGLESRTLAVQAGIGEKEGTLTFTDDLGTENYVATDADKGGIAVRMTPLDTALKSENPTFIKIDVEGFETKVFAGAGETIRKASLSAMIVERAGNGSRYGFDESALHKQIEATGFIPCRYSPLDRKLTRLPSDTIGNIIYVRDFDGAQRRVTEAAPFQHRGRSI